MRSVALLALTMFATGETLQARACDANTQEPTPAVTPQFANNLFVGTLRGTHLLRLRVDPASRRITGQERLLEGQGQFGRIRDVMSGPDGLLYFCTNNRDGRGNPVMGDDRIARLVPAP